MGTQRYLTVNVYPASEGWRVALIVKEAGRPYGRLLHHVTDMPVVYTAADLPGAARAAAAVLLEEFPPDPEY